MNTTLILVGVVCIIAAVVGGSLKALGIELPAIESVRRQIILGIIGLMLVFFGTFSGRDNPDQPINEIQPINDVEAANSADGINNAATRIGETPAEVSNQGNMAGSPTANEATPQPSALKPDPAERKRAAVQSVIDELNEATPFNAFAQNQFASGVLSYNHFLLSGGDVQIASTFTYQQGDGTGWPPPSPPKQAVDAYFCKGNATTAKLLKEGVHFIVTTNIVRGPNTSSSTFRVDCDAIDP